MASSAKLVAMVTESREGRSLTVFNDNDGGLLFEHTLSVRDRVAGFAETCWLIVGGRR
jgi:hypothetical protein